MLLLLVIWVGLPSQVAAADSTAECIDRSSDFHAMSFLCGQVGVVLERGAEMSTVIARSAPHAVVLNRSVSGDSYTLGVSTGSEWETILALRQDPGVKYAQLIAQGEPTIPNTSILSDRPPLDAFALICMAFAILAVLVLPRRVGAYRRD
jgi:hypothetical protein